MRRSQRKFMYIVKLPSGEYINLAFLQRVEVHLDVPIAMIYWSAGGKNLYRNEDAKAIIEAISNQYLDFSNDKTT